LKPFISRSLRVIFKIYHLKWDNKKDLKNLSYNTVYNKIVAKSLGSSTSCLLNFRNNLTSRGAMGSVLSDIQGFETK
jgi:hypothetical protein